MDPQKKPGALYSGPHLEARQASVINTAKEYYYAAPDAPPADVLVFFNNEWTRKRDVRHMARNLADFVRANYPQDKETVTLQQLSYEVRGWVDGLSVIRISRHGESWRAGAVTLSCYRTSTLRHALSARI